VEAGGARIAFLAALQPYRMYEEEDVYATAERSGPLLLQPEVVREDLDALAGRADVRILLVHWGRNYRAITGVQRELASDLRAGPADLVVGHHPHVAQRVELSPGCPVLFSIGNGAFPTGRGRFARRGVFGYGLVATAEFDDAHRLRGLDLALLDVENERVEFAPRQACGEHPRSYLRGIAPARDGWHEAPAPLAGASVRF
jgi:poly-gamma-glutamate capsule biosynthesis protein CapA/YwtB (metallophosphatase superfamily)